MWNLISIALLIVEAVMLASFTVARFRNKKLNETMIFLGLVFVINVALYLIPYIYSILEGYRGNYVFDLMNLFERSVKLFLGGMDTGAVSDFTIAFPVFTFTYLLGAVLALLATVSTTVIAFGNSIRNGFRLSARLKAEACDFVKGSGVSALQYAKGNDNCVLLLGADADKNAAAALMEKGYVVLRKGFNAEFLSSRMLNATTRYNFICPDDNGSGLTDIDTFITYWKSDVPKKNVYLYVELEKDKTETIRREIIEDCGCEERVTTFCSNELLARTFVEENPVTRFLPESYIDEDASIKPEMNIQVFLLGYGELSAEICRQMVLNNQLVKYENGEYRVLPIHYHIYDPSAPKGSWLLGGLQKALEELEEEKSAYFPLPELPADITVYDHIPHYRDTLSKMVRLARRPNTYSIFLVDTGDLYRNMETGSRLNTLLDGHADHHVFVRSDAAYTKDTELLSYYGDFTRIFCHDIIVNDSLSTMAKVVNRVYTEQYMRDRRSEPDFAEQVIRKAEEDWNGMDYFTLYSNIYGAMNLRVKLNMLGLDYRHGKADNHSDLLRIRYQKEDREYAYSEYFTRSRRNALLAQEHARWNAYHLLAEVLPMRRDEITVRSVQGEKVRFHAKNMAARKHACLTTFCGLDALSKHLAQTAQHITGTPHKAQEYDYYIYDEMLITSAEQLMELLDCQIFQR